MCVCVRVKKPRGPPVSSLGEGRTEREQICEEVPRVGNTGTDNPTQKMVNTLLLPELLETPSLVEGRGERSCRFKTVRTLGLSLAKWRSVDVHWGRPFLHDQISLTIWTGEPR